MSSSDNVIDLQKHRAKRQEDNIDERLDKLTASTPMGDKAPIVDISEMRQEMIEEEKRGVRRTILTEFIALHVVIPNKGLTKAMLYDISEDGLAFEMGTDDGQFQAGEMVAMRVYLNHKTYFPFVVQVNHIRYIDEEGVYRHGCAFQKDTINDIALFHFSKFIENISAFLKTDHGDVMVSNLGKK